MSMNEIENEMVMAKSDPKTLTAFYASYDREAISRHNRMRDRVRSLRGLPRRIGLFLSGTNTFNQSAARFDV